MVHIFKVYIVWFVVGLVLVGFDLIPEGLIWANSAFLMLAGLVGVYYAVQTFGRLKGIVICVCIFLTTFIIEGVSAYYDIFFGSYDYTDQFPPLLFGIPIGIGFAWIMMIMSGHALTVGIKHRFWSAFLAALYVVVLDLVLDPVAFVVKQYWIWEAQTIYYNIPFTNYMGWFVIAICWQLYLAFVEAKYDAASIKQMIVVFWTMVLFFFWIALLEQLWLAIAVTAISFIILEIVRRWFVEKTKTHTMGV